MTRAFILRAFTRAAAWVGVIALGSAMVLAQDAAPAPRSDGQIEMDVVHALDASQALKNDLITAATIQSEVTLSGTVSSESSKQLAESIAKTVPGVTKVNNNLKIGNPAEDANAQGAPLNDPANDMGDAEPQQNAQAPANGQDPNYGQTAGADQNAEAGQVPPSVNQGAPPDTGAQNQHRPEYGQDYPQQQPAYGQNYPQQQGQGYPPQQGQGYPPQQGPGYPPQQGQGYPQQSPYGQPPVYGQAPPPLSRGTGRDSLRCTSRGQCMRRLLHCNTRSRGGR